MSKLERLIQEHCPNGVKYAVLGDICEITKGVQFNKANMNETGSFPVINGGINPSGYIEQYNQTEDTITISQGGASAGYVNWISTKFWAGAHCYVVIPGSKILNRYLFHFLKAMEYKLLKFQYGAGIPALSKSTILNLRIPMLPLEIQQEIVRILDNFTELTAELTTELTTELTARKKQFEYYRSRLLTNGSTNTQKVQLSEVATFIYGYTDKAKDIGDTRFIRITDIMDNGTLNPNDAKYINLTNESKTYLLNYGDILMARTGATFGKTLYYSDNKPAVYASFLIKIVLDNNIILNRFYWHFAQSSLYWDQANKLVSTGGQPQFNAKALGRIMINVPSLEVQRKIVSILDRFDALCNDITQGLPAEIEARQKQYEYYRDKLLTFKELEA